MRFISSLTRIPRKVRVYGLLIILSLLLLALGHQLESWGIPKMIIHFTNEVGIAGLIGFVLAITIEKLSQDEFRKVAENERAEIKRDVFYYVYGHDIPLAIRDEIDAHILKVPYVRRGVVMQYELQPIQESTTNEWYVLTTFTMNYELENLTTEEFKFPFIAAIDKSPSDQFAKHTEFVRLSARGCKEPFDWRATELKGKQKDEDNELSLKLPDAIVLLPKQSAEEGTAISASRKLAQITLKTKTVRFLRGGHIDFIFTSHVCDLDLMVWADKRLKVSASTFEQNPLELVTEAPPSISWLNERLTESGELYYWKLKKPLLAYQALQISWTAPGISLDKLLAAAGSRAASESEPAASSQT